MTSVGYLAYSHWASYLINGDASGLEDSEVTDADAFIAWVGCGDPVGCEDYGFGHPDFPHNGLAGDLQTYTFLCDENQPVPAMGHFRKPDHE